MQPRILGAGSNKKANHALVFTLGEDLLPRNKALQAEAKMFKTSFGSEDIFFTAPQARLEEEAFRLFRGGLDRGFVKLHEALLGADSDVNHTEEPARVLGALYVKLCSTIAALTGRTSMDLVTADALPSVMQVIMQLNDDWKGVDHLVQNRALETNKPVFVVAVLLRQACGLQQKSIDFPTVIKTLDAEMFGRLERKLAKLGIPKIFIGQILWSGISERIGQGHKVVQARSAGTLKVALTATATPRKEDWGKGKEKEGIKSKQREEKGEKKRKRGEKGGGTQKKK